MSAEMIMPLTFATFFICGVKDLTSLTQRTCVIFLLTGIFSQKAKDGVVGVLADSECTNYVKGERKLSADIINELGNLTLEEAIERVKGIKIRNLTTSANALSILVRNSSLSEKDKEMLLRKYQEDQELTFITEVFLRSVMEDNRHLLTQEEKDTLKKYRDYHALSDDKSSMPATYGRQKLIDGARDAWGAKIEDEEDVGWMEGFLTVSNTKKPIMPSNREVVMRHGEIKLPEEYPWMVYLLKPALMEAKLRKYSMNDFLKVLNIDAGSNDLQEGKLEYWQFKGITDSVVELLKRIDFSDACGFVLQPVGVFELSQIENVENVLRVASNVNVKICTPLIFKDVSDFQLLLLVHRSKRISQEQRLDTDHDCTRIYEKKRNLENGYTSISKDKNFNNY